MKQNEVRDPRKKERIIKIDLEQLMNQLIARIMNHKKKRLKSNSKSLKIESNFNSNSNFNFRKLRLSKKKRKSSISFDEIKICSYCHKRDHKELHCRLKN